MVNVFVKLQNLPIEDKINIYLMYGKLRRNTGQVRAMDKNLLGTSNIGRHQQVGLNGFF